GYGMFTAITWENPQKHFGSADIGRLVLCDDSTIWWYRIQTVLILTTGTMLLMWLGEQITEHGIGEGVSLGMPMSTWGLFRAAGRDCRRGRRASRTCFFAAARPAISATPSR